MATAATAIRLSRLRLIFRFFAHLTEPPLAALVLQNGLKQLFAVEVRPERVNDMQLSITRLPEQKVRYAHLTGRANQQVRVRDIGCVEKIGKELFIDIMHIDDAPLDGVGDRLDGVQYFRPSTVIERQIQNEAFVVTGLVDRLHDDSPLIRRESGDSTGRDKLDVVFYQLLNIVK